MTEIILPPFPPFLPEVSLQPLPGYPDVLLLNAAFHASHFDDALFTRLQIPFPDNLKKSVIKRRAEYLASRYCLQQALTSFGIERFLLRNRADRSPIWPPGICGSLSHSHQWLCALLSRRNDLLMGIDCEQNMAAKTASEMAEMVVNPQEKQRLVALSLPFASALTTIFSIKESLYKAIWPQLQQCMNFSDAEMVACSEDMQQVRLRLTQTFSAQFYRGREFHAQVTLQPDRVLTWVIGPY